MLILSTEVMDLANSKLNNLDATSLSPSLKFLYLKNNQLSSLPEDFFRTLPNLKWLDLRNNHLEIIPTQGLENHNHLETLLLQGNRIKQLPLELASVPTLKGLQLAGNPIENIPLEILYGGLIKIVKYLKKIAIREETALLPVSNAGVCERRILMPKFTVVRKSAPYCRKASRSMRFCRAPDQPVSIDRILEEEKKNSAKNRLREVLIKQQQQIQRIMDKEMLKKWRKKSVRSLNIQNLLDNSQNFRTRAPYGTDPQLSIMLSRKDLFMSLADYENRQKLLRKPPRKRKVDLEGQIRDIARKLAQLGCEDKNDDESSLSTRKGRILSRMQKIDELRGTLKDLERKNQLCLNQP